MTQKGQYHVEKRSKSTYILVLAEKKVEFWSYPPSPLFLIPFIVLAVFKPFLTFFWILAGKKVEFWSYPPLGPFLAFLASAPFLAVFNPSDFLLDSSWKKGGVLVYPLPLLSFLLRPVFAVLTLSDFLLNSSWKKGGVLSYPFWPFYRFWHRPFLAVLSFFSVFDDF